MKLLLLLLFLSGLTISTTLPDSSPELTPDILARQEDPSPRQDNPGKPCGLATNSDASLSTALIGDATCHDFYTHGNTIKSYRVLKGCSCLFFANDACSKKPTEEWTGWVFGPAEGDLTKGGTTHHLCGEAKSPFQPPRN